MIFDLLLQRETFCLDLMEIFKLIESKKVQRFICATTITTIYYLVSKSFTKIKTDIIIEDLLNIFQIVEVNKEVLINALKNNGINFEDSVIYVSANFKEIELIVTRNIKSFKKSSIRILLPKEFLLIQI